MMEGKRVKSGRARPVEGGAKTVTITPDLATEAANRSPFAGVTPDVCPPRARRPVSRGGVPLPRLADRRY